ncbi:sugar kinase [Virgibacillus soli]|uniref:Sugar kinase n=1 Tax=Paracerasibacillus soli TaxID=480284 RepID=A0ABU5CT99_9BACI|nr:sugar kinase [Virgibacillus soli]MDY0409049.1 sugar kinase [Virgibacillus soli]
MIVDGKIKAFGEVMMRLEAPNYLKLEQARQLQVLYVGTGVNILSALSKYGHDTAMITKLPNNSLGDAASAYIRSLGITTTDIIRGGEYLGMYFLENGFHPRPTKVTYSNRYESSFCTASITEYDLEMLLLDTSLIHLCGIALAISDKTRESVLAIAKKAKQLGITVAFDFNYRPKLWDNQYEQARPYYKELLQYVDICFMAEKDAQYILNMETSETEQQKQIEDLIPKVAKKFAIHTIAGTMRKNDLMKDRQWLQGFIYRDETIHFSSEYKLKILDRLGAGDGFSSGVIHGLVERYPHEKLVEFATVASVLAHTTYGDSPICTEDEVWSFMNNNEVQIER